MVLLFASLIVYVLRCVVCYLMFAFDLWWVTCCFVTGVVVLRLVGNCWFVYWLLRSVCWLVLHCLLCFDCGVVI